MSEQDRLFQALSAMSGGAPGADHAEQLRQDVAQAAAEAGVEPEEMARMIRQSLSGQTPEPFTSRKPSSAARRRGPSPVALRPDTPVSRHRSQQSSPSRLYTRTVSRPTPEIDAPNRARAENALPKSNDS